MKKLHAHPVHLVAGLLIWSAWFVVIYGGQAVGCELARPADEAGAWTWLNAVLVLHTLLFTALLLYLTWAAHRSTPAERGNARFILRTSTTLYLVSAIATLVAGFPTLVLPPCV